MLVHTRDNRCAMVLVNFVHFMIASVKIMFLDKSVALLLFSFLRNMADDVFAPFCLIAPAAQHVEGNLTFFVNFQITSLETVSENQVGKDSTKKGWNFFKYAYF